MNRDQHLPLDPWNAASRDLEPWINRLMDEYKILQDKIDKIGNFRFTVKGWSVTLIAGALAAASAANNPGYVPLSLILVVITFFLLEYKQWELSIRFGTRAQEIEAALKRVRDDRGYDLLDIEIPGLARQLSRKGRRLTIRAHLWNRLVRSFSVDWLIYWVQLVLIVTVTWWLYTKPGSGDGHRAVTAVSEPHIVDTGARPRYKAAQDVEESR